MNDGLDFLLERPAPPADSYRWATVTATTPEVRIQLDGDTEPLESTPNKLCPVNVDDRVWIQIHGRAIVILGRSQ